MRSLSGWKLVLVLMVLSFTACGERDSPQAPREAREDAAGVSRSPWSEYRDRFIDAYFEAHPAFAVGAGRHQYDGQLPDWSAAGIAAEIERLHAAREATAAFSDAELDEGARFERDYLLARIERDLFWLEVAEAPFHNPAFYLDWTSDNLDPSPYLTREYAPLDRRMRAYIAYLRAIPEAAQQIRDNLRLPLSLPLLELGLSAFRGFGDFYESDGRATFESVTDSALRDELDQATAEASKAMHDLASWLDEQKPDATASFALGREKFEAMLRMTEQVDRPLEELEAAGRADMERNLAALRAACEELAPGESTQGCFAKMAGNKPEGGAVEAARRQLDVLRQFLDRQGLVSIPGDEQALVAEAPPYQRSNFAYIDIPGPYDQGLPAVYYIAPPDPAWTEEERRAYIPGRADLLFTSVHEVWPGHFLQFLHSNRSGSIVGRLFVGYAFSEGWAHYTEEMMWEAGLGEGDPEYRIGQLSNALLRNARFLSAIGLHTAGMTIEQSERLFHEEAFQDVGTARQQAARGAWDPAYGNYTLGKLLIRDLRDRWTAERGGKTAWRDFHDRFLSFGGPPISMIERAMMQEPAQAAAAAGSPSN